MSQARLSGKVVSAMLAAVVAAGLAACAPPPSASPTSQDRATLWMASKPPGPYIGFAPDRLPPTAFRSKDRIVATYYFYWYDDASRAHFVDPDGSDALQDHPANPKGYSYLSEAWHRRELLDIMEAGVDVILPVYWGNPADKLKQGDLNWSFQGIPPLVRAAQMLRSEGKRPPKIGLFYDTSTLQHNASRYHADLSTEEGKSWFYVTIRDFFSMVPPDLWATIDGKPVVFLYAAAFAKAGSDDPSLVSYLRRNFARDFGGAVPYLVQEISWKLPADSSYAWGAAFGLRVHGVAALCPGYNDRAVPGRTTPIQEREGGAFYARNWERLLAMSPERRPKMVVVETWNELHEGTDICDTKEYGRLYIGLTKKYAAKWRAGEKLPRTGRFANTQLYLARLALGSASPGVVFPVKNEDGQYAQDRTGLTALPNRVSENRYLYFGVDDSFFFDDTDWALEVQVSFAGPVPALEYDSHDPAATLGGSYKAAPAPSVEDGGDWKLAVFRLPDPKLAGRQNGGADFRLAVSGDLRVRFIALKKQDR